VSLSALGGAMKVLLGTGRFYRLRLGPRKLGQRRGWHFVRWWGRTAARWNWKQYL